ncbi:hypothetical protein Bca4012_098490 [Brassica carinata]
MLGKAVKEKNGSVSREVFECLKRQQKNLIKMDGVVHASSTGSACYLASSSLGLALAAVRNRRRKTLSRRGQIPPAISGMLADLHFNQIEKFPTLNSPRKEMSRTALPSQLLTEVKHTEERLSFQSSHDFALRLKWNFLQTKTPYLTWLTSPIPLIPNQNKPNLITSLVILLGFPPSQLISLPPIPGITGITSSPIPNISRNWQDTIGNMGILDLLVSQIPFEVRRVSRFVEPSLAEFNGEKLLSKEGVTEKVGTVAATALTSEDLDVLRLTSQNSLNLRCFTREVRIWSVLFRRSMQQAEFYSNNVFRAYEKRVQPSIFICDFLDLRNLVLRVTDNDKVDYPDVRKRIRIRLAGLLTSLSRISSLDVEARSAAKKKGLSSMPSQHMDRIVTRYAPMHGERGTSCHDVVWSASAPEECLGEGFSAVIAPSAAAG